MGSNYLIMTQKIAHIFSPLTPRQEEVVLERMDTSFKCPVCACGRVVRKNVGEMLRQTFTPDEIWRTLRNDGYALKLKHNDLETFTKAIEKHVLVCLRENVLDYEAKLKERKANEKLFRDLERQVRSRGIEIDINPSRDTHIQNGEPEIKEVVTPKQFKSEMSELIPAIILNNLRALKSEQEKYLRGERSHPPDLKAIDTVLRSLKALIGSAEIADFMRDN